MSDILKIRDFIYLDIERMRSIFAQLEKGLIESSTDEKGEDKRIHGKAATSTLLDVLGIKAEGMGEIFFKNKETETRSLHDHIYNHVEKRLKDEKSIIIIESDSEIKKKWENGHLNDKIPDTSFILVKGRVMLDDYDRFTKLAGNINDIMEALTFLQGQFEAPFDNQDLECWERIMRKTLMEQGVLMNEKFIKSLVLVVNAFFLDRLVIKVFPYPKNINLKLVGNLNRNFLRDSIESIIFKYGTAPVSDWWIFGQISSIFPENYDPADSIKDIKYKRMIKNLDTVNEILGHGEDFNSLDISDQNSWKSLGFTDADFEFLKKKGMEFPLENVFHAFRTIDHEASFKFPTVTFTPIAVYRGD